MTKLVHTMIRVRDLDRSVRFYREALELAVRDHFPSTVFPSPTLPMTRVVSNSN